MADKEKKEDQADQGSKGNKMKLIIIAAAAVILVIGVGVGAYFLGAASSKSQDMPAATTPGEPPEAAPTPTPPPSAIAQIAPQAMTGGPVGPMVEVDNFIINLLDMDTSRYLKAKISLEVSTPQTAEEIQARMSQIRDAILLLAGNKTYAELRDLQGKMQLRAELLGHINALLETGQVKKIYFTDFVIQ